jgi:hypothetical protein
LKRVVTIFALLTVLFLAFAGSRAVNAVGISQVTLSYSVVGGGQFQPPILQYVLDGKIVKTPLSTTPTLYNVDFDSSWNASTVLPGSNSTQRWSVNGTATGVAAGQKLVLTYYRQYYVTFEIAAYGSLSGLRSAPFPLLNYTSFGNTTKTYPNKSVWADYMSPYVYGNGTAHIPGTRWYISGGRGLIEAALTIRPLYIEQYLLNFTFSSTGPDRLRSTTVMGTFGGNTINRTLNTPGGAFWFDVNSSLTLQQAVYSTSGSSRWFLHSLSQSNADSPANVTAQYIEQYPVSVPFVISSGTAPSPPILVATIDDQVTSAQLIAGASPTWVDAGTEYSIPSLLQGSTSLERWITESTTSGVASGPVTLNVEYFHQVLVELDYSVSGGGSIGAFNASFVSFGAQKSTPVNATQGSVWADYGTVLSVKGSFSGSQLERWELGSSPSVTLASPEVLYLVYYHQFDVPMAYTFSGGGNPGRPELTGYELGTQFTSPFQSGSLVWLDSGTFWSVPGVLQGELTGERWVGVGSTNGTVASSTSLDVTYQLEYYVAVSSNPSGAGSLSGQGWVPTGESVRVSASAGRGYAFIGWVGTGPGSYSGRNQSFSVTLTGPVEETADYYVGLAIQVVGKGTVTVSYGSSSLSVGSQLTIYVSPGTNITLTAKPGILESFAGWQGIPAGNAGAVLIVAAAPVGASAVFVINEVEALGVVVLCFGGAIYMIAYLLWGRRASPGRLRDMMRRSVKVTG